jgi:hypothetical protein
MEKFFFLKIRSEKELIIKISKNIRILTNEFKKMRCLSYLKKILLFENKQY